MINISNTNIMIGKEKHVQEKLMFFMVQTPTRYVHCISKDLVGRSEKREDSTIRQCILVKFISEAKLLGKIVIPVFNGESVDPCRSNFQGAYMLNFHMLS